MEVKLMGTPLTANHQLSTDVYSIICPLGISSQREEKMMEALKLFTEFDTLWIDSRGTQRFFDT